RASLRRAVEAVVPSPRPLDARAAADDVAGAVGLVVGPAGAHRAVDGKSIACREAVAAQNGDGAYRGCVAVAVEVAPAKPEAEGLARRERGSLRSERERNARLQPGNGPERIAVVRGQITVGIRRHELQRAGLAVPALVRGDARRGVS